jgi:ribosomal-protein-alanine N-acetyltransferase
VSGDLEIVPAAPALAEALAAHHALSFAEAWSADSFARMLAIPGTFGAVARGAGEIVGFVLARAGGGEGEILTIGVDPQKRRQGVGRALLTAAIAEARRRGATDIFLEVGEDNEAALSLYLREGFHAIGRRPGYYRVADTATDALTLKRSLDPI